MYLQVVVSIAWVSSSARVTSVKFHKVLGGREVQRPGPIDRTPETPGSGKNINLNVNVNVNVNVEETVLQGT